MASGQQGTTIKEYRVVNEDDPNHVFLVEASSYEDAAQEALTCLGWFVAVRDGEPPDDEQ
jgi:hypothetical protein